MTWNIPIKPDGSCLRYLANNYRYDAETGSFHWIKEGGKGKSKHFIGDTVSGNFGGGYMKLYAGSRYLNASHVAWWFVHGEWPCKSIDHINRNTKDNSAVNLRLADAELQSENRSAWNADGLPKGVQRRGNKYRAVKKHTRLGTFASVEEAKRAYEAAHV